jgi:Peptidase family C25/Propeptide_C25/Dockerin type I domain
MKKKYALKHPVIMQGLFVIISLMILIPLSAIAEEFTMHYSFDRPLIEDVTVKGISYQRIIMNDAPCGGLPDHPALPSRGARILIPYGQEIESIEIISGERIDLGDGYNILPVTIPYILSQGPDERNAPHPNPEIYSKTTPFPAQRHENISSQSFRGYEIEVLRMMPVEYIPASGELAYYADLTVIVKTTKSEKSSTNFRGHENDQMEVLTKIDNPEMLNSYASATKRGSKSYDLLIITDPDYISAFQPLKDYHDTTGILTEIHTTVDIGSTDPTAVRDYIRDRYLNDGIEYVIIGGDDDVIPAVDLYVISSDNPDNYVEYEMPTDMYFGCLDGTYNYDGDSYWGEPTDGDGGGDVDLITEVYIGRASVNSVSEVNNFVNKTIQYFETEADYLNDVLMCGENLAFGGLGEYGGYALDEIIDATDRHGYSTVGIPSTVYDVQKLYDLTWPGNYWPTSELISRINSGLHIINHYGHANPEWNLKMNLMNLITAVSNSDHCFIYSQGCSAGRFDDTDCWAEMSTSQLPHACFAVIMNARYGYGDYDTDGPAQRFDREFFDAVYNPAENITEIGKANNDSKEDQIYRINDACMRWTAYQLNLFGDPTVQLKSRGGLTFDYPSGIPEMLSPQNKTKFRVDIGCICGGTMVPASSQLHYVINGGELQTVSLSEIQPGEFEVDLPAIDCGDLLEFYVSAEEQTQGRIYHPGQTSPFTAFASQETVILFSDNFESDNGWTTTGSMWERGVPIGGGGIDHVYGGQDPTGGTNGENVFGYNLSGDYANGIGSEYLVSPLINCQSKNNVHLKFDRWLCVGEPSDDQGKVQFSIDGSNWTDVWENPAVIADNQWMDVELDISDIADDQPIVFLRWVMGPTNYTTRFSGWNIDDIEVISYLCGSSFLCGDANADAEVNVSDAVHIINYVFVGGNPPDPLESGDVNCDITCNVSDAVWIINYVFVGGNMPCDSDGDEFPDC